ncbi:MAG TPA: HNH endonuclease [Deltaproteobacteria bacterium]|nr:HNH endonuclease [Deltaproteobacteria bacterium]HPA08819.1 HNH endonuclease [Methanoregulaceae archaeon]
MDALKRSLIEKAGNEQGWELVVTSNETGVVLASSRHKAQIRITQQTPHQTWLVTVPTGLICQELTRSFPDAFQKESTFMAVGWDHLAHLLRRTAELALSLPDQAALTYAERVEKEIAKIQDCTTEVERLVKQRIGQDTFREALMDYWGRSCSVTGLNMPEVLRASHAKPWAKCESDEERLDVFNGLLLCANLDALFDRGMITFDAGGRIICSLRITPEQQSMLHIHDTMTLRWVAPEHVPYLAWHRDHVFLA